MSVKQISVFLENRPGTLNEMTKILADNKIDMRALSVSETKDFGIARIIVDDVFAATNTLKKEGYVASLTPVLAYAVPGGVPHYPRQFGCIRRRRSSGAGSRLPSA